MELSALTLRLLLLFIPGLIAAYLFDALTNGPRKERFHFLLRALFFGLSSYFTYWLVIKLAYLRALNTERPQVEFLLVLTDATLPIPYREIFVVCIIGLLLGAVSTYAFTFRIFYRLSHWLKMSNKFGESDVWSYAFNSDDVVWVTVRDHANGLTFDGWAEVFSEGSERFELLLRDVKVYNLGSGDKLYDVGAIYLSRERSNATIEFRSVPLSDSTTGEAATEDDTNEPVTKGETGTSLPRQPTKRRHK